MSADVINRIWHTTNAGGGDIVEKSVFTGRAMLLEIAGENTSMADFYLQI